MQLAIQVPYDPTLLDMVETLGLRHVQLRIGPGFPIATDDPSLADARAAAADLKRRGLQVVALGCYRNLLSADPGERRQERERLEIVMTMAPLFGTDLVGVFAGRDPERSVDDNLPRFARTWAPLADRAERLGLRLAVENCTMLRGDPPRSINLAATPWAYEQMFAHVPSHALGIELDPSHLHKQHLDPIAFVERFGHRIMHVHAKDHEHLPAMLAAHGRFDTRTSRDRLPGTGEIDFAALFAALHRMDYSGDVTLEVERGTDGGGLGDPNAVGIVRDAVGFLRSVLP